jgi:hypothetical protein
LYASFTEQCRAAHLDFYNDVHAFSGERQTHAAAWKLKKMLTVIVDRLTSLL